MSEQKKSHQRDFDRVILVYDYGDNYGRDEDLSFESINFPGRWIEFDSDEQKRKVDIFIR